MRGHDSENASSEAMEAMTERRGATPLPLTSILETVSVDFSDENREKVEL